MPSDFEKTLRFIFDHENVYAKGHYGDERYVVSENVSGDPGGLTKYGIDKASHPTVDVENLTKEQATAIYAKEWDEAEADLMPWPVNLAYFDPVVNSGKRQAVRLLQRAVGSYDDGILGPNTFKALESKIAATSAFDVAIAICDQRDALYDAIVARKPHMKKFLEGWDDRVDDLEEIVEVEAKKPIRKTKKTTV